MAGKKDPLGGSFSLAETLWQRNNGRRKRPNSGMLQRSRRARLVNPGERRLHGPVTPSQQIGPFQRDRFVRDHTPSFQSRSGGGYKIAIRVDEKIAVWESVEQGRERLPH